MLFQDLKTTNHLPSKEKRAKVNTKMKKALSKKLLNLQKLKEKTSFSKLITVKERPRFAVLWGKFIFKFN